MLTMVTSAALQLVVLAVYCASTNTDSSSLYACDYIDPLTNQSDCGVCVANTSCSWCTYDNSCHETANYDSAQCNASLAHGGQTHSIAIIAGGWDALYQCCDASTTCSQCTHLYYVECDWCVSSQTCFNSSDAILSGCDSGHADNGKDIVYKDGVCWAEPHDTWWTKFVTFWLEIPLLYRIILASLASLCLLLFFAFCALCCKQKYDVRKIRRHHQRLGHERLINHAAQQQRQQQQPQQQQQQQSYKKSNVRVQRSQPAQQDFNYVKIENIAS